MFKFPRKTYICSTCFDKIKEFIQEQTEIRLDDNEFSDFNSYNGNRFCEMCKLGGQINYFICKDSKDK